MFEKILSILNSMFVFVDEVARILALAFVAKKNVIIFGPAGHGKSEMVTSVIEGLKLTDDCLVQFFGEGMDEARMFGGLNFRKLEDEKVLEYYPEKSFLNYKVAVFEELFDAPPMVLKALKDTLTARELRNGSQRFKMRTELIICLTNKEPSEISALGPDAHALVERFPLQLNLKWKDYSAKSYLAMFEKIAKRIAGPVLNGFKAILAEILAKTTAEGNFVSPRTAVHAYGVCQAAAQLRGADHVEKCDLTDLRFVPGLEKLADTIQKELEVAMERAACEQKVQEAERKFHALHTEFAQSNTPIKYLQCAKKFAGFGDEVSGLKVTDGFADRRKQLRDKSAELAANAQKRALEETRV
jgi:hypothetical protein